MDSEVKTPDVFDPKSCMNTVGQEVLELCAIHKVHPEAQDIPRLECRKRLTKAQRHEICRCLGLEGKS